MSNKEATLLQYGKITTELRHNSQQMLRPGIFIPDFLEFFLSRLRFIWGNILYNFLYKLNNAF